MTLSAYETLYESGVAFGIRKSLMSEKGKMDIIDKVKWFNFLFISNMCELFLQSVTLLFSEFSSTKYAKTCLQY